MGQPQRRSLPKGRNEEKKRLHKNAADEWGAERELAKAERRRVGWAKPKRGPLEKRLPTPWSAPECRRVRER